MNFNIYLLTDRLIWCDPIIRIVMEIKFIAQGLNVENNNPAGEKIIEALSQNNYNSFNAFVAFVSISGIRNIEDQLIEFKNRGSNIRLYVGVDLHGTSKEALERLIELEIPTYIVFSPNGIVYHPKIYTFEGEINSFVIVGSSNLTASGLFQNIEASVCVSYLNEDDKGIEFISDIHDSFNLLITNEGTYCKELNPLILDLLVRNKVVLPESVNRSITNKIASENTTVSTSDREELLREFKKFKPTRPPKGYKRFVEQEVIIPSEDSDEDSLVVYNSIEIGFDSMWIVTGQMTGASRNILDLSKNGKRDNINKFGSIDFFGVDKDNPEDYKDIDIMYNGRIYKRNHIFFALQNSNWRIQLKGITDDGYKLTDISRPHFGHQGGFQNRILIFERTSTENLYNLYIAEQEDLEKLKEASEDWAYGGHGSGRAYGITSHNNPE